VSDIEEKCMIEATRAVLGLLAEEQRVWSIEELAREIGGAGSRARRRRRPFARRLVNRVNQRFACASRAALRAAQITGEDV
jgi:hypothetical protein